MSITPGPWRVGLNQNGFNLPLAQRETTDCIIAADGSHVVCAGHDYDEFGLIPSRDDARLIAAAPDLLEACRRALRDATEWDGDMSEVLEAAIAKAEGR